MTWSTYSLKDARAGREHSWQWNSTTSVLQRDVCKPRTLVQHLPEQSPGHPHLPAVPRLDHDVLVARLHEYSSPTGYKDPVLTSASTSSSIARQEPDLWMAALGPFTIQQHHQLTVLMSKLYEAPHVTVSHSFKCGNHKQSNYQHPPTIKRLMPPPILQCSKINNFG